MAGPLTNSCEILEDIDFDDFIDEIGKIILLQAMVRGFLVRKWVAKTRSCFEAIAQEIEQRSNVSVEWKYTCLCCPALQKKRRKKSDSEIKNLQNDTADDAKEKNICETCSSENIMKCRITGGGTNTFKCTSEKDSKFKKENRGTNFQSIDATVNKTSKDTSHWDEGTDNHTSKNLSSDMSEENHNLANRYEAPKSWENVEASTCKSRNVVTSDSKSQLIPSGSRTHAASSDSREDLTTSNSGRCDVAFESRITDYDPDVIETVEKRLASTQTDCVIISDTDDSISDNYTNMSSKQTGTTNWQNSVDKSTSDTDLLPVRLKSLAIQTDFVSEHLEKESETEQNFRPKNNEDVRHNFSGEKINHLAGSRSPSEVRESRNSADESSLPLGDSTSFWGESSVTYNGTPSPKPKHIKEGEISSTSYQDADLLKEKRQHVTMELLWVQQAIQSRKNYLRLKHQMKTPVKG